MTKQSRRKLWESLQVNKRGDVTYTIVPIRIIVFIHKYYVNTLIMIYRHQSEGQYQSFMLKQPLLSLKLRIILIAYTYNSLIQ